MAVPRAVPTPLEPKRAAAAPSSLQRSKLTLPPEPKSISKCHRSSKPQTEVVLTMQVLARETALRAHFVTSSRAQVVDLDHNALRTSEGCIVGVWVSLCRQLETQPAGGTGAGARAHAEKVLRCGSIVTRVAVPAAGGSGGVTVLGAEGVASAIPVHIFSRLW